MHCFTLHAVSRLATTDADFFLLFWVSFLFSLYNFGQLDTDGVIHAVCNIYLNL